jgi:hypothetical protein
MLDYCLKHRSAYVSSGKRPGEQPCPKCEAEKPPSVDNEAVVIAAADPAKLNDYFAYADIKIQNKKARLLSVKEWAHKNYSVVIPEIAQRVNSVKARFLVVDTGGVGEPIKEMFRMRGVRTLDINFGEYVDWQDPWSGNRSKVSVKYAMVQYCRYCSQLGLVELPNNVPRLQEQLKEQELVQGADPEHHEDTRVKYGHPSGTHDDLCWAFLMALYVSRRWLTGGWGWVKPASLLAKKASQ